MQTERPHKRRLATRHGLAIAIVVALAVQWWLAYALRWGNRTTIALGIAGVLALLLIFVDWLIARLGPPLWRVLKSVALTAGRALRQDPELLHIAERHPRLVSWLRRRLTLSSPRGLYLTATVLVAAYFLIGYLSIAVNVGLARAITHYDPQIYALVRAFRSPALTRIFYTATLFGDPSAFLPLLAVAALLLVMWAKRREALLLAGTVATGFAVGWLTKFVIARARPPIDGALIRQPVSFSFPSGHALATALFAFTLVFVLLRLVRPIRRRIVIVSIALSAVGLVGLSRVYLGMHWPSDVLASWMLALGWCSLTCGAFAILQRYGPPEPAAKPWFGPKTRWIITSTVTKVAALLVALAAAFDPLLPQLTAPPPSAPWPARETSAGMPAPDTRDLAELPVYSEKIDGTRQEPIGIIFVGTADQLVHDFETAGWRVADKPTVTTLFNVSVAALTGKRYPTAPVTPTFLDGKVQDYAFEKEADVANARQRHHTRFWKTRFTFKGAPVWVATSSFDSRLELGTALPIPTHHIEPNIDAERDYIVADLGKAGVKHLEDVRVAPAQSGTNAAGDTFYTNGMAALLVPAP